MTENKPFLKHIHYFRAFAIINIVIVHAWRIPLRYGESQEFSYNLINAIREVFFHDSTIFFIYISGFLFCYLSKNLRPLTYYKNKLSYVISPYVFISVFILALGHLRANGFSFLQKWETINEIAYALIEGGAQVQFWYIPFIALVFVVSPLLLKIPATGSGRFILIVSVLPLLGSRTDTSVSLWQYIYFFPVYLQGIYAAKNHSIFMATLERWKTEMIIIALVSSIFLGYLHFNPVSHDLFNITESVYYVQKLSICFSTLLLFQKLENKDNALLDKLAKYSFAIFFTHMLVYQALMPNRYYSWFISSGALMFFFSLIHVVAVIFATLFVCAMLKTILGKRSRYFIGA